MAEIEPLTITLPSDMAAMVESAVANGDYASTGEVVREAIRDWEMKRALQSGAGRAEGRHRQRLVDIAAGRMKKFDVDRIIARGRKLSASRSPAA